ncbi:MAG TPA: adenosine-specific kinase [Thermodesulfovibrionales bacterium]|nr:adenosine-specific kinase [Thermodesulfovibrionales bacterium]
MEFKAVDVQIPAGCNIVLGQTHFIKTAEDLYELIITTVPQAKFGIAFTEASGPCLIRSEGNDNDLTGACVKTLQDIGAGHLFCILLRDAYPINILNAVKSCQEVCGIYCATANPLQILVASTAQGNSVIGVVDGFAPRGVETSDDRMQRKDFLRKIGYKA